MYITWTWTEHYLKNVHGHVNKVRLCANCVQTVCTLCANCVQTVCNMLASCWQAVGKLEKFDKVDKVKI